MESNFFRRLNLGPHHRFWRRFMRLCFVVGPGSYVGEPTRRAQKSRGAFLSFLGLFREGGLFGRPLFGLP